MGLVISRFFIPSSQETQRLRMFTVLPTFAASDHAEPSEPKYFAGESHLSSPFFGEHPEVLPLNSAVQGAAGRWAPATASRRAGRPGHSTCRAPQSRWYLGG